MDEETKAAMESGKPVMIFHINSVGQMNPSATTVNNHYWGDEFVPVEDAGGKISGAVRRKDNKSKAEPKAKPERKSTLPKPDPKPADGKLPEQMTFSKRGITDIHLSFLYKKMVEDGWLTDDTKEANFKALFSGERTSLTITWAGKYGRGTLVYFFQQLELDGLITVPKGFTIPRILMGHVLETNGQFITRLDKGEAPAEKSGPEIIEYIKILKVNADRQGRRAAHIDHSDDYMDDDFTGYGEELSSHLEDEGLSYSTKPY